MRTIICESRKIIITVFSLFLIITSCKKEPEKVGLEIQSGNEPSIYYTDNVEVRAFSVREDSVRTDQTTNNLFGSYWDPDFGLTTAGFNTQFRLPENGHSFGTDPVLDSIVLFLDYNGYYGDTNSLLNVKAYELSEKIFLDSSYYSNDNATDYGLVLADLTFSPRPNTSVEINGETGVPQLVLRLSDDLGNKILSADESVFSDNESFMDFFYGIKLMAAPASSPFSGSMVYFNLISSVSQMVIYYNNSSKQDSLQFSFIINDKAARFNMFEHNYDLASVDFKEQLGIGQPADTALGDEVVYLQAMGGVKVRLHFPDLTKIADSGKVAVNEAKLVLNGVGDNDGYRFPADLALIKIKEDGTTTLLIDQFEPYFGGIYDSTNKQYVFRITRHVQRLINGEELDYGLYLLITRASYIGDRLMVTGPDPDPMEAARRLKLSVIYTRVE